MPHRSRPVTAGLILLFLSGVAVAKPAASFTIASGGRAATAILVAQNRQAELAEAAGILAGCLNDITGAEFTVRADGPNDGGIRLAV